MKLGPGETALLMRHPSHLDAGDANLVGLQHQQEGTYHVMGFHPLQRFLFLRFAYQSARKNLLDFYTQ